MTTLPPPPKRLDRQRIRIAAQSVRDQRKHRRVRLAMPGRYLDPVRGEFRCKLIDVSPGGARILAEVPPPVGERVVMLFEGLGRLEGDVVRAGRAGFAVRFSHGQRKRDRLADAITWRYNMTRLGLTDDRGAARKPSKGQTYLRLRDGVVIKADVIDVSITGAAFSCLERPRLGDKVVAGEMTGRVVRWLENGFAVAFDPPASDRGASDSGEASAA